MEPTELYNLIALGGLLLCKVILLVLIFFYCCRKKKNATAAATVTSARSSPRVATVADTANQTEEDCKNKGDIPPTYSAIMLQIDPPEYLDSILNEDLNPVLNHRCMVTSCFPAAIN
jgi:hypothetical protein